MFADNFRALLFVQQVSIVYADNAAGGGALSSEQLTVEEAAVFESQALTEVDLGGLSDSRVEQRDENGRAEPAAGDVARATARAGWCSTARLRAMATQRS